MTHMNPMPAESGAARDYLAILIVDANDLVAGTLAARCPTTFAEPNMLLQATTMADAVSQLQAVPDPDFILLDGDIPCSPTDGRNVNGLEMMAQLRAIYPGRMIAISTRYVIRTEMIRAGCVDGIGKWDTDHLERLIHNLINTR